MLGMLGMPGMLGMLGMGCACPAAPGVGTAPGAAGAHATPAGCWGNKGFQSRALAESTGARGFPFCVSSLGKERTEPPL